MPSRPAATMALLCVAGLAACGDTDMSAAPGFPPAPPLRRLADVPDSSLARLAGRVVLFGHQSVGANLVQGIREWAATDPRVAGLRVTPLASAPDSGGMLVETLIGDNGEPLRKTSDFLAALETPVGQRASVALEKYCYLDFGPENDPAAVFANYKAKIGALEASRPGLVVVHVTTPLTARETGPKAWLKRVMGKTTQDDLNARRAAYNDLLRAEYGGRQPLFDLAAYESTGPDGARAGVVRDGKAIPALAPAWTDDGGHLNTQGRKVIAEQFLVFLAELP